MPVNKLELISTKSGDGGDSKNFESRSYRKSHILFDTMGTIDELSSFLGLSFHYCKEGFFKEIQMDLQNINSLIATDFNSDLYNILTQINEDDVKKLEVRIQEMLDIKPLEGRFYLPGSEKSLAGAYLDVARTIARRAERLFIKYIDSEQRDDLELSKKYINRLSDYIFVLTFNV